MPMQGRAGGDDIPVHGPVVVFAGQTSPLAMPGQGAIAGVVVVAFSGSILFQLSRRVPCDGRRRAAPWDALGTGLPLPRRTDDADVEIVEAFDGGGHGGKC